MLAIMEPPIILICMLIQHPIGSQLLSLLVKITSCGGPVQMPLIGLSALLIYNFRGFQTYNGSKGSC